MNSENVFSLVKVASEHTQSFRRLLKRIKKWFTSHPMEVKLGKCFARYFNIKIPGLRRYEQLDDYKDKKTKLPPKEVSLFGDIWRFSRKESNSAGYTASAKAIQQKSFYTLLKQLYYAVWDAFEGMMKNVQHYRDIITQNQMLVCLWDYSVKKFWTWVDSAPEP